MDFAVGKEPLHGGVVQQLDRVSVILDLFSIGSCHKSPAGEKSGDEIISKELWTPVKKERGVMDLEREPAIGSLAINGFTDAPKLGGKGRLILPVSNMFNYGVRVGEIE